jgi:predicted ester cyclase
VASDEKTDAPIRGYCAAGGSSTFGGQTPMSTEHHEQVIRSIYADESIRRGGAHLDEVFSPGFVAHNLFPGAPPGLAGMKAALAGLLEGLPDARFTVEHLVAQGDLVAARVVLRGTHRGPLLGVPPTGRELELCEHIFVRFEHGKVAESWALRDDLGMMRQLGLAG